MRHLLPALMLVFALLGRALAGDDWPQFRGPDGQGHSDSVGLPLEWSEAQNVVWKTPIHGQGWSSPVVQGNQIWMTTALDAGHSLHAVCVDRRSGRIVHDVEVFQVEHPPAIHPTNSFASPTPILDGGRVYVHFGSMGTACLDADSGHVEWQSRELQWQHQVGPGATPALYGDVLIFSCDGIDARFVAALDKRTGKLAWKTDRTGAIEKGPSESKAFVTPLVINVAGRDLAFMVGASWAHAYEPLTGKEMWRIGHPGYSVVPRPVYGHGLIFFCTGFDSPELWAIRPEGEGVLSEESVVWKLTKQVPSKASPLLVGDELYIVSENGVATCLDAQTGQERWRNRLPGTYTASPVAADGRIYMASEDGKTVVLAPGREFHQLAINQLDGRFMASPAIAGKAFFLRTDTHLYRIETKAEGGAMNDE